MPHRRTLFLPEDALQGAKKEHTVELEAVRIVGGNERAALHIEVDNPHHYLIIPKSWHMCARPHESEPYLLAAKVARKRDTFRDPRGEGSVPDSYNFFKITNVVNRAFAFIGMQPDGTGIGEIRFARNSRSVEVTFERNRMNVARNEDPPPIKVVISNDASAYAHKDLEERVRSASPRGSEIIWFSWPVYGRNIEERSILREAQAAAEMPEDARPTTLLIDDGHTSHHGDTLMDRRRFPDPQATVRRIKELGLKAGVWEPLTLVSKNSRLAKERRHWLVKDRKGKAARVAYYLPTGKTVPPLIAPLGLDISIPEVREHIAEKIKRYEDLGFGVIKLDFMAACFVGELQCRERTPLEYYHELFALINQKYLDWLARPSGGVGWRRSHPEHHGQRHTTHPPLRWASIQRHVFAGGDHGRKKKIFGAKRSPGRHSPKRIGDYSGRCGPGRQSHAGLFRLPAHVYRGQPCRCGKKRKERMVGVYQAFQGKVKPVESTLIT